MSFLVNISELLKYAGEGVRRYEEGENVFNANHLVYCGITKEDDTNIVLMLLCLQTSDLYGLPHEIKIEISITNNIKHIQCVCSCKAGLSGRCKHCVAALVYLVKTPRCSIEHATCTDVKQTWGKLKLNAKSMYEARALETFCHGTQKSNKYPNVDQAKKNQVLDILIKANPDSMLAKLRKGYSLTKGNEADTIDYTAKYCFKFIEERVCRDLLNTQIYPMININSALYFIHSNGRWVYFRFSDFRDEEKKFYHNEVKVDLDKAVALSCDAKSQRGQVWLFERRKRIITSCAYKLITYLDNKHPDDAWLTKVQNHLNNEFQGSRSTAHEIKYEKKARICYEAISTHIVILSGLLVHPNVPWLGYSPDGIVLNSNLIEIKCLLSGEKKTAQDVAASLKILEKNGENYVLKSNKTFFCQAQLGMFVTNMRKCDLILYASFDDTCVIVEILYNEEYINNIIAKLQCIYFRYMLKLIANLNK